MGSCTASTSRHPLPILIVEDDRVSRKALALLLNSCGYDTTAVGSAEEALKLMRGTERPAIALVDLDLPGMNGLDLISRLKQADSHVFAVLITAADEDRVGGEVRRGLLPYLRKPLNFGRLLTLLHDSCLAEKN